VADDTALLARVKELIATGRIPRKPPARTMGGSGSGRSCAVCGDAVGPADVEYEMDFDDGASLAVHIRCFHLLERARHDVAS
jgi:hypothetical protein